MSSWQKYSTLAGELSDSVKATAHGVSERQQHQVLHLRGRAQVRYRQNLIKLYQVYYGVWVVLSDDRPYTIINFVELEEIQYSGERLV